MIAKGAREAGMDIGKYGGVRRGSQTKEMAQPTQSPNLYCRSGLVKCSKALVKLMGTGYFMEKKLFLWSLECQDLLQYPLQCSVVPSIQKVDPKGNV